MANATDFVIAGNDEHGIDPPTYGKRTPIMPYINRSFYENEFNYPTKNYFLAHAARVNFGTFDVKPEKQDMSITTRVNRVNSRGISLVVTFAYNATVNERFNGYGGLEVFWSAQNVQSARSRTLANAVYNRTSQNGYVRGNGVLTLSNVGMLSSVRVPATLIEAGFMTNFNEAKLMVDPDYQQLIGRLSVQGVCDYLGVPYYTVEQTNFPTLRSGSRGTSVSYLQFRLLNYGYFISGDGVFGPATLNAVKKFQSDNSLVADGIVGRNTWAKINNLNPTGVTLRRGSRGVETYYLQQKLLSKLYPVSVDGIFGPATEAQVRAFQSENALTVDGIVGRNTWAKVATIGGGRNL